VALTAGADHPQACRLFKVDRQCFRCGRSSPAGPEAEFASSMNVHYSEPVPDPQHLMASDYLMLRAGLDSESKISPLSSPLGTSPGL
jgi:hypothetical protein